MRRLRFALTTLMVTAAAAAFVDHSAAAEPRGVVELFTSQGCSSCPPADKLIGELAKDSSIVALSLPIDYWDYLGWRDTLARPRHSARQRGYSTARGDREVYTPQVVVNGQVHVLGSDRSAIELALRRTRQQGRTMSVPVTLAVQNDRVDVTVPAGKETGSGEVWLCQVAKAVPVSVGRGENRGRTLTYHNVVRKWTKLGPWTGAAHTWSVPKSEFESDVDTLAVLVQGGTMETPGVMLGAAVASLR